MTSPLRTKYVVQKLDDEGNLKYEFLTKARTPTEDLDEANEFGSKLAATLVLRAMYEAVEDERWGWAIVPKDTIEVRPPRLDAPFDLVIADPLEAVKMVYEKHHEYCDKVEKWLGFACGINGFSRPECKITITGPTWAGLYTSNEHACHYPVAYAMLVKDYEETVAHEVVHGYQRAFTGQRVGHGPDFYALMRHAARRPTNTHFHNYDVPEVERLSDKLRPWWALARQKGALASLPCKVETKGRKRKGLK